MESDDAVYEDLGSGSTLYFPDNTGLDDSSDHELIGQWGELLVKHYLEKCREDPESGIIDIAWSDEVKQTGLPYDFVVQTKLKNGSVMLIKQ